MSPIQARYGLVPDVSHLRRFGCLCYSHVPSETREKGFVDKSYKCYFLGIDMPTQAYKVWVVDNSEVRISSNVLFDEFAKVKLAEHAVVPVSTTTTDFKDFNYLIGMVYRDDENSLMYVSSRLAVQKGDICTVFFGLDFIKSNFLHFFSGKKLDFFQKFSVHILFFEFYLAIQSLKAYCY